MKLTVSNEKEGYPVIIESDSLARAENYISYSFKHCRIMIISDDNVFPLYGEKLVHALPSYECSLLVLPHGETSKSFKILPLIYSAMIEHSITRSDLVIALGGGVIGDLAGFAAATFLRGINLVQIPTSLLSQVDSCIGGKAAVDLPQGKNLVGAFYDPKLVIIDPEVLHTLPEHFMKDGMGEIIKYACVYDRDLFELLTGCGSFNGLKEHLTEVIFRCIDLKRQTVEKDPHDKKERMLLNFGHTLGHAIEQHLHYEGVSHGEAVSVGMYRITKLSEKYGLTRKGTSEKILMLLKKYSLPAECDIPLNLLTEAVSRDKKNFGHTLNLILLKCIGEAFIYPSSLDFFTAGGEI